MQQMQAFMTRVCNVDMNLKIRYVSFEREKRRTAFLEAQETDFTRQTMKVHDQLLLSHSKKRQSMRSSRLLTYREEI